MDSWIIRRGCAGSAVRRWLSAGCLVAFAGAGCTDTAGSPSAGAGDSSEGGEPEHSDAGEPGETHPPANAGEGGREAHAGTANDGGRAGGAHEGGHPSIGGAAGAGTSDAEAGAGWVSDEGSVGFDDATKVECDNDEKALGPALYPVEPGPAATQFADLNDDGRDDWLMLVTGSVSVRLGVLGGGWEEPTLYPVGATPRQLLLTDVNLDGAVDLVVGNGYDASISLLFGKANGTFGAAKTFAAPGIIEGIVVAKLNADKYPDLAITTVNQQVVALLNTGFERFEIGYADTLMSARAIAALDINADGANDLMAVGAATNGEGFSVLSFLNDGKGAFTRGASYLPGTFPLLLAADLNHDGVQDLVVADTFDPHVSVLFVKKSGGFERPQRYRLAAPPSALATVDADRDGELDLAVAVEGWSPGVVVLRNQGDGKLGAATSYTLGGVSSRLSVGDVNADGAPDLVLTHPEVDSITPLLNRGTGRFAGPITYPTSEDAFDGIALDLDDDGHPDLARLGQAGGLGISLNLGDGRFGPPQTYATGSIANAVVALDSDRDQKLDVAVASGEGILVFRGQGDGTLASPLTHAPGTFIYSLAASDLDGDGYDDLAFTGGDDASIGAIFGQADGSFGAPQLYPRPNAATPYMISTGDYDGDDKLDLASISLGGSKLAVLKNLGDRAFAEAVEYDTGEAPLQLVSAHLDHDEHLDIAVVSRSKLNIFINHGDGTFGATQYPAGPNAAYLVPGDFDDSGNVSFLVHSLENQTVTLHLNDGSAQFSAARRFGGVRGMIGADFDSDGATDVATCVGSGFAVMTSVCPGVADAL